MLYFKRGIQTAALLTSLVAIAGCVVAPEIKESRSLDAYRSKPNNEGLLIASSVINTGEVGQLWTIQLQKLDAVQSAGKSSKTPPPEYTLKNLIGGSSRDQSLFVGALPTGRYKIVTLSFGGKYMNLREGDKISPVVVEAGKVSDLGMIVITAANFNVLTGRSKKFTDSQMLIKRFFPSDELLQQPAISGWEKPLSENDVAEEFALAHPQGIGTLAELSSKEVVAGTRMGTLLARNTEGRWRVMARLNTFDAITFVAPYPRSGKSEAVLALTDAGEAYVYADDKLEKLATGNLPAGRIFFLDNNEQAGRWIIGVQHNQQAELMTSETLLNGNWTSLFKDDISFSTWSGARNAWAAKIPGGVAYGSSETPLLRCFSYDTNKWQTVSTPDKRTLTDVRANAQTGGIGILTSPGGGFGGIFAKSHIAQKCGADWAQIKTPYSVEVAAPIFLNDGSLAVVGGVFGDEGFYVTADKGKNWSKRSNQKVLSDNFYQTLSQGLFLIDKGQFGVEFVSHSADGGATWQTELSSIDKELLKAMQDNKAPK